MAEIYVKLANGTMQKVHLETDSAQVKGLSDAVKIIKVDNTVSADKLANAKEIKIQDADGNASTAANFDGSENVNLNLPDTILNQRQLGYRQPNTAYAVGNIKYHSALPTGWYLECTTEGTSGSGDLPISSPSIGGTVTDGTVEWTIWNQAKALMTGLNISYSGNLNDVTQSGAYFVHKNASNLPISNDSSWSNLLVLNADDLVIQLCCCNDKNAYIRIKPLNESWAAWQRLITEAGWNASAAMHNSIYRGNDLTSYWNSGQMSVDIQAGNFSNIYPGDYIIKDITIDGVTYSNVKFIVMDLDYHLHCGDYETTAHHVVIMPEEALGSAQMNAEHTTAGGYLGSKMWTEHMPKVTAGFESAFGAAHILEHRELLSNAMDANAKSNAYDGWGGAASGWAWASVKANLANEDMVYGAPVLSSSFFDTGECNSQLAAFRLNHGLICSKRYWWWLRSVAGASHFCVVAGGGYADYTDAAYSGGVRPIALLR